MDGTVLSRIVLWGGLCAGVLIGVQENKIELVLSDTLYEKQASFWGSKIGYALGPVEAYCAYKCAMTWAEVIRSEIQACAPEDIKQLDPEITQGLPEISELEMGNRLNTLTEKTVKSYEKLVEERSIKVMVQFLKSRGKK